MQYLEIRGGRPLYGEISVQGSKNAALPVLTACLLGEGPCVIENCPQIRDVEDTLAILRGLGCAVSQTGSRIRIQGAGANQSRIIGPEAARIRSSVLFLGALLGKMKKAAIPWPGGCAIGSRPVDLHLQALRALGAEFREFSPSGAEAGCRNPDSSGEMRTPASGSICARARELRGARIRLPFPSVGATENVILAAVCADGETILERPAQEPEIEELCSFLNRRGADIVRQEDGSIRLRGVSALHPAVWRLRPDRIVAGTWLLAVAGAGGKISLRNCPDGELGALFPVLWQMGAKIEKQKQPGRLLLSQERVRPRAVSYIETAPYPGFPTDLQSPLMAALVRADGKSVIREKIFENRLKTAEQLGRMGAKIAVEEDRAVITGVERLHAARLLTPDLRGGAALAAAALQAKGTTRIDGYGLIARGYEALAENYRRLGAGVRLRRA